MAQAKPVDLVVLHEHPEWQKPLFAALEKRGVSFAPFDLKAAAFDEADVPQAKLYFNQASPSAYLRGNVRAVPFALALMRSLEEAGARVLNGSRSFSLELSKSAQAALLRKLGLRGPRTITFNDAKAVRPRAAGFPWPALLKPEQGGSGARMFLLEGPDDMGCFRIDQCGCFDALATLRIVLVPDGAPETFTEPGPSNLCPPSGFHTGAGQTDRCGDGPFASPHFGEELLFEIADNRDLHA